MKLSNAVSIIFSLWAAVQAGFMPTILVLRYSPSYLLHLHALLDIFFYHVWFVFGNGIDENARIGKEKIISPNAHGVVLDIGAGRGHTIKYLDRSRVSKYIALEPNVYMHPEIRKVANAAGFAEDTHSLLVLPYAAEDISSILSALEKPQVVDTLISVLTLCSVPHPERTLSALVAEVLKPGGQLLFYEHVLHPRSDVRWWQQFWTPIWKRAFGGCCLDRPTDVWLAKMRAWSHGEMWAEDGEDEERLFWHRLGIYVKA